MKKILTVIIIGLLSFSMFSMFAPQVKAQETILFSDDFESYAVGTLPSPPWEFWFNTNGEIVSTTYVSLTKSLRLLGATGWATEAIRRFTSSSRFIGYEVYAKAEAVGAAYASVVVGFAIRTGPGTSSYYAAVYFGNDGNIHAGAVTFPYVPNTWYKIKVLFDRDSNTYDVWIDNILKASSAPGGAPDPYAIEGLMLDSDWAAVNCYFDDAKVFEGRAAPPIFPWRDDFNYNTKDEMKNAGWTLSNEFMISVGGGAVTLDNDGSVGSEVIYSSFPSGIYDWRAETSGMWIGRSYDGIHLSVLTERHDYRWGGDGAFQEFVLYRDEVKVLRFGSYTPQLNTWVKFAIEKRGNTIYLYYNDELKNTYIEPDNTPSALIGVMLWSGWIATVKYDYISVTSPTVPDFEISVSPASRTIIPKQSTTYMVNVRSINGFNSWVSLTATINPVSTDISLTFDPIQVLPPADGSAQLTLKVATTRKVERSIYTITIAGSSGEITHSATVTLKVGKWITDTIDSVGDVGRYASIAVDSKDNIHISYYDGTNGKLKYAKWNGNTWVTTTVDPDVWFAGMYSSIALDSKDNPHISYRAGPNLLQDELRYAKYDGNSWVITTVATPIGANIEATSIALDSYDYPHIVFRVVTLGLVDTVRYTRWNGEAWVEPTILFLMPTLGGMFNLLPSVDIAIDAHNNPHVAYLSYTISISGKPPGTIVTPTIHFTYAKFEAGQWIKEDITPVIGPNPIATTGMSIALDSNNKPHTVFKERNKVTHAKREPSKWKTSTVSTESIVFTTYPSITLNSEDSPTITYNDVSIKSGSLMYTVWSEGKWIKEEVDSAGYPGLGAFTSIALDSNDRPHIAYYDLSNQDLKYATLDP